MAYVYVFCHGNAVHAATEQQRPSPKSTVPTRKIFTLLYETLQDTGILTHVRVTDDREVNRDFDEQANTVQLYSVVRMYITRRITIH